MDTAENERKEMMEQEKDHLRQLFAQREPPLMQEERKQANEMLKTQLEEIDNLINSVSVNTMYKATLILFKTTLEMHFSNLNAIFSTVEYATNLNASSQKAIIYIADKVSQASTSTNELKNTMINIQAVLEEKKINEITRIMTKIENQIEQSKKASEAYRV